MCHYMLIDVITIFVGLHMQHEGFTENWSWITHEGKLRTNNFYTCSKSDNNNFVLMPKSFYKFT